MTSIKRIAVVGGGFMGSGIALISAANHYDVVIVDVSEEQIKKSKTYVDQELQIRAGRRFKTDPDARAKFVQDTDAHLTYSWNLQEAVHDVDLVIEAIVEVLDKKHKLFIDIERFVRPDTILVTNTSSLLVAEISKPIKLRQRFAGLHFFGKIVEIIRGSDTNDATFDALKAYAERIDIVPIACQDTRGFVGNGLLIPFLTAAAKMVEDGIADPRDIDRVFKIGFGHFLGPIEMCDNIGLDVCNNIVQSMHVAKPSDPLYAPGMFAKLVAEGKLGRKSGQGFYNYTQVAVSKL